MTISLADLRSTQFFPEILPDAEVLSIGANSEEDVLDLRRFGNRLLIMQNIASEQNANIDLKINHDRTRFRTSTNALPNRFPAIFDIISKNFIEASFLNTSGSTISDYRVFFSLLVKRPTVADKIIQGIELTEEDRRIAERLNIVEEVERGLLPLPFSVQRERQYHLFQERKTFTFDGSVDSTESAIESIRAFEDEFIVLEALNATTPAASSVNVRLKVDRDDDDDLVDVPIFAYNFADDLNAPAFIPAKNELRFKVVANSSTTARIRFTVGRYKLNNILRARFGLVSEDEVEKGLIDKIKAGIL